MTIILCGTRQCDDAHDRFIRTGGIKQFTPPVLGVSRDMLTKPDTLQYCISVVLYFSIPETRRVGSPAVFCHYMYLVLPKYLSTCTSHGIA